MSTTIELARQLIRLPSVTPEDGGCQRLMRERLEPLGFHCESLRSHDVDNLWAVRGTVGPLFVFAGHTDVVPCGDEAHWTHPPYAAIVEDGILHGRGAADMKGSLAAMITACEEALSSDPELFDRLRLGFLITSDEEGIAKHGTREVIDVLKERGERIDYCLVGEPSSTQKLGDTKATKFWFTRSMSDSGSREWHGQSQVALMNLHYQDKEWQSVIDVFKKGDFKLDQKTALQRLIMTAKSHEALGNTKEVSRFEVEISKLSPKTMTGYQASYRALVRSHLTKVPDFPRKAEIFLQQYGEEQKLDAKTHSIRLLLANHYYKKKNYRSALDHYQELRLGLIDKSNLLGTRYHLAKSAIALNLEQESLDAIAAFFRGHPGAKQEISLLLNRAEIYSKQGQTDAALKDYETILTKTTDEKLRLNLMQRLSALYQERKDYPKLVNVQEKLLAIPTLDNEAKASANFWLGWNEYRLKNHAKSLPYLVKARELAPGKFTTQVGPILIRCAFQASDLKLLQKEIELLRQSDRNAPLPSVITTWLGANLAKAEQHQKGWAFLKEGISTSKEKIQPVIWRLFAKSSLAAKKPADALKAAEEILKLDESAYRKAEAHFFQSQAYVESQKFEEARQAASDALDLRPQGELDIALRLHAGDIEMAAKKSGEALRHYLIVESLYSKSPEDKKTAAAKVVACLKAIGTPEALKKLPEFEAKAKAKAK